MASAGWLIEGMWMRQESLWQPSKYSVLECGGLAASQDRSELAPSSRLFAGLIAEFYNQVIPRFASGALLDLGCGKQPMYGSYREHVRSVTAVDWPSSLHESPHLDLFCDVSTTLPFRSSSFDTVLSSDVLEHLPDPTVVFAEFGRLLRPGGVLLLNTPFLYPVHEEPHDYLRHTRFSLARLAERAGLEVVVLEPIGGVLEVLLDTAAKLVGQLPGVGPVLAAVLQGAGLRARRLTPWQRVSVVTAPYYSLGHGLVARKPA